VSFGWLQAAAGLADLSVGSTIRGWIKRLIQLSSLPISWQLEMGSADTQSKSSIASSSSGQPCRAFWLGHRETQWTDLVTSISWRIRGQHQIGLRDASPYREFDFVPRVPRHFSEQCLGG